MISDTEEIENSALNLKKRDIRSSMPQRTYPLVRSGGLFLICIGAGIIGAVFLSGAAFIVGTVLAIMSLMLSKVLSFGKPTRIQIIALVFAIALEIILFIIMVHAQQDAKRGQAFVFTNDHVISQKRLVF